MSQHVENIGQCPAHSNPLIQVHYSNSLFEYTTVLNQIIVPRLFSTWLHRYFLSIYIYNGHIIIIASCLSSPLPHRGFQWVEGFTFLDSRMESNIRKVAILQCTLQLYDNGCIGFVNHCFCSELKAFSSVWNTYHPGTLNPNYGISYQMKLWSKTQGNGFFVKIALTRCILHICISLCIF